MYRLDTPYSKVWQSLPYAHPKRGDKSQSTNTIALPSNLVPTVDRTTPTGQASLGNGLSPLQKDVVVTRPGRVADMQQVLQPSIDEQKAKEQLL
jgi:hypothetical protein